MIGVVGLDHHLAPAAVRERVSFAGECLELALGYLHADPALDEVLILSTCNRTEIYASSGDWPRACARIQQFLDDHYAAECARAHTDGAPAEGATSLRHYLYIMQGPEAARHLFAVAAGLRSMVAGETQVLAQVKEAFQQAAALQCVGEELQMLFNAAIKVGKRVRAETGITRVDASIGAAAVARARAILGSLEHRTVLVLGAGRTSQLCARLLRLSGTGRLILSNRTTGSSGRTGRQRWRRNRASGADRFGHPGCGSYHQCNGGTPYHASRLAAGILHAGAAAPAARA